MLQVSLLLLLLLFGGSTADRVSDVPIYDIDLDLDPRDRWTAPILAYKNKLIAIKDEIISHVDPKVLDKLIRTADAVEHFWPPNLEIRQELEGIADLIDTDVGIILALNLHYELEPWLTATSSTKPPQTVGCTSLLAQRQGTSVLHGRNLDYGIPNLQDITIQVRFFRSGRLLYEAVTYVGYIGMGTSVKAGMFSLSQDAREMEGSKWDDIWAAIFRGGRSMAFLMREVMETANDYESAAHILQTTPLLTDSYFILASDDGRGMVISRSRLQAVDVWELDEKEHDRVHPVSSSFRSTHRAATSQQLNGPLLWYLVQTNDDHWLPPADHRRDTANALMETLSPSTVSADDVWTVMNTHPVLNRGTVFSAVMEASTGYLRVQTQRENYTMFE